LVGLCMWTAGYKRRLMSILESAGLVFEFMAETWLEYTICREEPPGYPDPMVYRHGFVSP
jgi:hypothetical protein